MCFESDSACVTMEVWPILLTLLGIFLFFLISIKIFIKYITTWCKSYCCLIGKTAIITGANSGIGYATALELAKRGCRVILACRNMEKANEAREKIVTMTNNPNVVVMKIDMESLQSVRDFAEEFCLNEERLDILINNAGAANLGERTSVDGFEIFTQVNYLSSVLLTHLLIDKLKESAPSRIVTVTSQGAAYSRFSMNKFNKYPSSMFAAMFAYSNTKLCQIFHTVMLAEELEGTGVTINALHPGPVRTEAINSFDKKYRWLFNIGSYLYYKTPEEGAQTTIYVAVANENEQVNGGLFEECKQIKLYRTASNRPLCEAVWSKTKEMLKI